MIEGTVKILKIVSVCVKLLMLLGCKHTLNTAILGIEDYGTKDYYSTKNFPSNLGACAIRILIGTDQILL